MEVSGTAQHARNNPKKNQDFNAFKQKILDFEGGTFNPVGSLKEVPSDQETSFTEQPMDMSSVLESTKRTVIPAGERLGTPYGREKYEELDPGTAPEYPQDKKDRYERMAKAQAIGQGLSSLFQAFMVGQGLDVPDNQDQALPYIQSKLEGIDQQYYNDLAAQRNREWEAQKYNTGLANQRYADQNRQQEIKEERLLELQREARDRKFKQKLADDALAEERRQFNIRQDQAGKEYEAGKRGSLLKSADLYNDSIRLKIMELDNIDPLIDPNQYRIKEQEISELQEQRDSILKELQGREGFKVVGDEKSGDDMPSSVGQALQQYPQKQQPQAQPQQQDPQKLGSQFSQILVDIDSSGRATTEQVNQLYEIAEKLGKSREEAEAFILSKIGNLPIPK